ncbi:MAG: tripartite tricarboxylate transporter permease [Eubacteriales bacterium]|nr:tripartite tricarboxylate transporter permease [Eubacteriales bacterium]
MIELLLDGFVNVLVPGNFIYLLGGLILGVVMGAIPGLTATMAIALIIPLTFTISPTQSLIMLLGAYNGGIFGGSISAILLATPGTPSAAATVADGFKLAQKGQAGKAIKTALISSVFGGLFSSIVLILVAEPIARYALKFGPGEFTIIMLFSLTIIASASGKSMIKGLIGGCLGLLFGFVGMDPVYSIPRFTFGNVNLSSGINLVVMLIGSLAVAEILIQIESVARGRTNAHLPPPMTKDDDRLTFKEFKTLLKTLVRSSALGCAIGALPGLGPTLASYVGYDMAKRNSKNPQKFGEGAIEGVAAAEAANNAVCGANLIPLLSLGVPGDTVAAMLIGAFLIQGLTPGPLIFREAPELVYNIYSGLIISNILLFAFVMLTYKFFTNIGKLETTVIFPVVCMFCIVGVYAFNQSLFDVWIMLFFAVLGYILMKFNFPPATMMIGFILAPLFETNFRLALLISNNSYAIFFKSPITWFFWGATLLSIVTIARGKIKDVLAERAIDKELNNI